MRECASICLILFFAHKICVSVLFQSGRLCNDIDYFCAERGEAFFGIVFAVRLRWGEGRDVREGLWVCGVKEGRRKVVRKRVRNKVEGTRVKSGVGRAQRTSMSITILPSLNADALTSRSLSDVSIPSNPLSLV